MKFGKTFESHLTSEWRQQYINYVVSMNNMNAVDYTRQIA